ncbi:Nuclease [Kangiella geojedonensis]|uniref:Nuclease n=2 Tax=Kangiella geojedonensis TaxID=914150 RepID=A0A0F6RD87_9GAMM|nr:Nuclease [Kangiella geojedonensis]
MNNSMWRLVLVFCLLIATTSCSQAGEAGYQLVYVQDGDSAVLCCDKGKQFTVRLLDIDAPEKHQPYAEDSKARLERFLKGESLALRGSKRDRYGRRLAVIEVNGESINDKMVESGAAWVWKYSKSKRMRALQQEAKESAIGLWALPEAQRQNPWEWRQSHPRK